MNQNQNQTWPVPAGRRPLTARQLARLDRVVADVRAGGDLAPACSRRRIRYETALRGLGLPTGAATVTSAALSASISRWPSA